MKLKRVAACIASALAVIAPTTIAASGEANAAPAGNIVTLGDSFTANPDQILNTFKKTPIPNAVGYPNREGCLQAPNNWPRKLGAKTGAPISDWSCTAQTSQTMLHRLDRAIASGDVHRGTRSVVIAVGANDYGGFGIAQGFQPWNPAKMRADYVNNIKIAKAKIARHAPQAKVVISGMIAMADPKAPHMFCAVNVIPNKPGGVPVPLLATVERDNEGNQRAAANAIGASFVPMRMASAGNTPCAPDNNRFAAGVIDTTTPNYNMAFHPSDRGSEFIANKLKPVV